MYVDYHGVLQVKYLLNSKPLANKPRSSRIFKQMASICMYHKCHRRKLVAVVFK